MAIAYVNIGTAGLRAVWRKGPGWEEDLEVVLGPRIQKRAAKRTPIAVVAGSAQPGTAREQESGIVVLEDDEVFVGLMGKLAHGPGGKKRSAIFQEWARTNNRVPLLIFAEVVKFLRFLRRTIEEQYDTPPVYSQRQLDTWYSECEEGRAVGSKL